MECSMNDQKEEEADPNMKKRKREYALFIDWVEFIYVKKWDAYICFKQETKI